MSQKAFLIVIDSNFNAATLASMHQALKSDKNVHGWWHHIKNTYIVITSNTVTVSSIQKFVASYFPKTDCLVLQLKPPYNNYDGWLPQNAWDWMENSLNKV